MCERDTAEREFSVAHPHAGHSRRPSCAGCEWLHQAHSPPHAARRAGRRRGASAAVRHQLRLVPSPALGRRRCENPHHTNHSSCRRNSQGFRGCSRVRRECFERQPHPTCCLTQAGALLWWFAGADGSTEGHSTAPRTRRLSVSDISYGSTSSHSVGTCGSDGFSGALSDGSPVRETNSGSLYCESTAAAGHGNGHHVPASSSCCDSQLSHPLSVSR